MQYADSSEFSDKLGALSEVTKEVEKVLKLANSGI